MWVKLTDLNDRPCLGVRFTWDDVADRDSGNYNFSRQEDVKDPEFGNWGSEFRFDLTARNVCDPAVNGGVDVYYTPWSDGEYEQVTVQDGVVSWMWSEPVYYWGFGGNDAEEDTFDPEPYAADYIYVLVDDDNEGTEDGGITDVVTLADNLNRLIQAKADIKSAIENKGVEVGDITLDGYAEKIGEIVSATVNVAALGIKLAHSTFQTLPAFLDFNEVTDMRNMFYACRNLKKLDLTPWDLSSVTDMSRMWLGCNALTEIRMSGDISNAKCDEMFDSLMAQSGTFYYDSNYDYSKIIEQLPSNWTAVPLE